jgi:hypothetical protein
MGSNTFSLLHLYYILLDNEIIYTTVTAFYLDSKQN